MKFYLSQLPLLLSKISQDQIKALLLYGPDKGHINRIFNEIRTHLATWSSTVTYQEFNTQTLAILNARNFFNNKEIIKIIDVNNNITDKIKIVFNEEFENFPIFIANELKSGSLKKFFETDDRLAIIGCYNDTAIDINKYILKKCKENLINLDSEGLLYLQTHLKGDNFYIENEVNKIIAFVLPKNTIEITDIKLVLSYDLSNNYDQLCIYFVHHDFNNFTIEFNKLIDSGINSVQVLRILLKYYTNLYIVKVKVLSGIETNFAIKELLPPIFYKYIDEFKIIVKQIKVAKILHTINVLQDAEIKYKIQSYNFDFYQQVFLKIYI